MIKAFRLLPVPSKPSSVHPNMDFASFTFLQNLLFHMNTHPRFRNTTQSFMFWRLHWLSQGQNWQGKTNIVFFFLHLNSMFSEATKWTLTRRDLSSRYSRTSCPTYCWYNGFEKCGPATGSRRLRHFRFHWRASSNGKFYQVESSRFRKYSTCVTLNSTVKVAIHSFYWYVQW